MRLQTKILAGYLVLVAVICSMAAILVHERGRMREMVVFHRVCLRSVCFRSDDAKLMDNFISYIKTIIFVYPANKMDSAGKPVFSNMTAPIQTTKDFRGCYDGDSFVAFR